MASMSWDIAVDTAVRNLTVVEQAVLKARFGIPADDERVHRVPRSPLSAAQARQIERRALRKLRADGTARPSKREHPTAAGEPHWRLMENTELLNMAVFKLHECAQRMLALAQAAQSPALSATFLSVYQQLVQEQADLQAAACAAAHAPSHTKSTALTAA